MTFRDPAECGVECVQTYPLKRVITGVSDAYLVKNCNNDKEKTDDRHHEEEMDLDIISSRDLCFFTENFEFVGQKAIFI